MKTNADIILDSFFNKLTKKAQVAQSAQSAPANPKQIALANLYKVFINYYHNGVSYAKEVLSLEQDIDNTLAQLKYNDPASALEIYSATYERMKTMVANTDNAKQQLVQGMAKLTEIINTLKAPKA